MDFTNWTKKVFYLNNTFLVIVLHFFFSVVFHWTIFFSTEASERTNTKEDKHFFKNWLPWIMTIDYPYFRRKACVPCHNILIKSVWFFVHAFKWITRKPKLTLITKKKRTCHQVDFAVQADHKMKVKENEKLEKYFITGRQNKLPCRDLPININISSYTPALGQLYPGTTGTD